MIVRNSQRVPPCSAREGAVSSTGTASNLNDRFGRHRVIYAKAHYELRQDFPDQSRIGLTARQRDTLDFIRHVIDEFGRAPTIAEIADGIGALAPSQVVHLLKALAERGHIRRSRRVRSIEIIPLVGPSLNGEPLMFIPVHPAASSQTRSEDNAR